jgi:hypothetical protein
METKQINPLQKTFEGTGEVSGYIFNQKFSDDNFYIHEVSREDPSIKPYYEVIKRLSARVCLDFENRTYSETEYKEIYPNSSRFGQDAWTAFSYDKALQIMTEKQPKS